MTGPALRRAQTIQSRLRKRRVAPGFRDATARTASEIRQVRDDEGDTPQERDDTRRWDVQRLDPRSLVDDERWTALVTIRTAVTMSAGQVWERGPQQDQGGPEPADHDHPTPPMRPKAVAQGEPSDREHERCDGEVRHRVDPDPPQRWRDEDEKRRDRAVDCAEDRSKNAGTVEACEVRRHVL